MAVRPSNDFHVGFAMPEPRKKDFALGNSYCIRVHLLGDDSMVKVFPCIS